MGVYGRTFAQFNTHQAIDHQTFVFPNGVTVSGGNQTMNCNYQVGNVDVFVRGIKMAESEFTADNGTSVSIPVATLSMTAGDEITIIGRKYPTADIMNSGAVNISGGQVNNTTMNNSTLTNASITAGTIGSSVSFSDRSNYKISTVKKSDQHSESLNTIYFDSLCYVEFYDLAVGDRILLHFVGYSDGKWWHQGRWAPSFSWGCYIDTNGGTSPDFGNVWAKNDGATTSNSYPKRIMWDHPDQVGGASNTWTFDTDSSFTPPTIAGDQGYFIAGDANNLPGNSMGTSGSGWHLLQIPSGFAGSYRFHRVIYAAYWQDINGTFYPYGSSSHAPHYLEAWKLDGGPIQ